MLAYSSIAQMGFMLLGLCSGVVYDNTVSAGNSFDVDAIVLIAVMLLGNAPVVRQVLERIRPAKKEVVKEGDAA